MCPNQAAVENSFTCPTGAANITSSTTVSVANGNTVLNNINVGSGSTITFATQGPSDVLRVNVNSITAGQGSTFNITGGGSVVLTLAGNMAINKNSYFGVNSVDTLLPAADLEVESCSTSVGTTKTGTAAAVEFDQGSQISAVFIAPQGSVDMNQAQLMDGAILANNMQFDRSTTFSYDSSAASLGSSGGYSEPVSWQDVP